ncbi:hypothetical protein BH10CYA1_BH10CYA1_58240 [soil metagenome]
MTVFPIPKRFFLSYYVAILLAPGAQAEFRQSLLQLASNSTSEQLEDKTKIIDPCTQQVIDVMPAPADRPNALDLVKDRDPELFNQIQAKVTDPRYTGELGNITVSTHDKKGDVNGCVFVQNVPYWQSGPAAQSLVDVNRELATRGKILEADPLNGAGRTLAQEEAIVWRNSGLHAKVGKSNHGFGKAEDFKPDPDPNARTQPWDDPFVNATLHAHGWRQGDTWGPLKNDLHHWSFVGPGPATDGPPPSKPLQSHHRHHHHRS